MKQLFIEKEKGLLKQAQKIYPELLHEFPLPLSLSEIKTYDHHLPRPFSFSFKLTRLLDQIKTKFGMGGIAIYQKLILTNLIIDSLSKFEQRKLPESIISLYKSWFERIYADFSVQPDFYYDHKKNLWAILQDIGVSSERFIPVGGAWYVELRVLKRKSLIKQARQRSLDENVENRHTRQSLLKPFLATLMAMGIHKIVKRKLTVMVSEVIGYSWCYMIHTAQRNIHDFNREQMDLAYHNIAELLKLDHHIWGVHRMSWLLDPELEKISPNLLFLREVPLNNGADLFYSGPCDVSECRQATLLSPVRDQMYHKGLYNPKRYFYFWPRQKVIEGCYDS